MSLLQLTSFQGTKIVYSVDLGVLKTFLGSPKRWPLASTIRKVGPDG